MLQGKELILSTKKYALEDPRSSWIQTVSTLLLLLAAQWSSLLAPLLILRVAGSVATGLLIIRFFIIFHDYQHHTILHNSRAAKVVMTFFGLYILTPPSIWKRSHDHHHQHNSKLFSADIGSYPIVTKTRFLAMSTRERMGYLAIRHPLTILLGYFTMFIWGMCLRSFISSPKKHTDSVVALVLHGTISAAIWYFFGFEGWLLGVFLPFFLGQAIGAYLFYAQHNFPGVVFKDRCGWTYEGAALESSSYMQMSPFMQWCTGNIGFHHIHHLNCRIPFYRLPRVMKEIPELQTAKTTSLHPRDVRDCLRLKVWDPERQQMIGFREIYADFQGSPGLAQKS
ncbi:fatty acid desaturase family protein [Dinghuibacter silviterrae]|uniref:Omega-6 fatty acid desaturase (Delta-12 desaturase) n=1 Tax=Dinghuibacter silviterrae TaxID=1539049 RepID=A0A4V3GLP4_9BACT|nr:fatty acid desaturase [Dinghuibacter silviterrae]TDX00323.1 omega-6 fatty acid desaturase (delta-12 desaturase) [Dinghuibacter silviterrae]